jgi:hypothetical protein
MESLARIRAARGDMGGAIRTAESASREKARMHEGMADVWAWAVLERTRAELYRKARRTEQARHVEIQLRHFLVFADLDYPVLAELQNNEGN